MSNGEAKKELEEAVEAVEELIEGHKMPFRRWLIKLIVEKLLAPVLASAITAALTSILGWYVIGQQQVQLEAQKVGIEAGAKAAGAEAAKLEEARALLAEWEASRRAPVPPVDKPKALEKADIDAALKKMRAEWEKRYANAPTGPKPLVTLHGQDQDPDSGKTDAAIQRMQMQIQIQEQRQEFPEEYIRARIEQEQLQHQEE